MSISTGKGDDGTTALLFGRRVAKDHPRVEAYGTIDELSANLGWLAVSPELWPDEVSLLREAQKALMKVMTELATDDADQEKAAVKYPFLGEVEVGFLNQKIKDLEANGKTFRGFELAGTNDRNARAHLARCVCRRAERRLQTLRASGSVCRPLLAVYLNRLSDFLWLLGRE